MRWLHLIVGGLALIPALESSARAHGGGLDELSAYRLIAFGEARRAGVPYPLVDAVMRVESGYDPLARGQAGEVGLMQVMPGTAALLGFSGTMDELSQPRTNIRLGATYLAEAYRLAQGDVCTAVMKYRAGHGETRFSYLSVEYCRRVRIHLEALGFPVSGPLPVATFGTPVAMFDDFGAQPKLKRQKKRDCFRRVVQAGRRFGSCISKARFANMGLLKGS